MTFIISEEQLESFRYTQSQFDIDIIINAVKSQQQKKEEDYNRGCTSRRALLDHILSIKYFISSVMSFEEYALNQNRNSTLLAALDLLAEENSALIKMGITEGGDR